MIGGVQVPQSSGETDYDRADRKLKILEGKIAGNSAITPKTDRGSFAALLEAVEINQTIKGRASLEDTKRRIEKHLSPILGHLPAGKVTANTIEAYVLERQKEKAANASINRELAIINRAFVLGIRAGSVSSKPYIEMLPEDNVRDGFFTPENFRDIMAKASTLLRDVITVAYRTGWRLESVILLEWRNVSLDRRLIGLTAQQTKNRKATAFPLEPFPDLMEVFERLKDEKERLEKEKGKIIPRVFHRGGEPVSSIRKAFEGARKRAGLPGRKFHDFRRSAVVNLEDMGFTETEIMDMVGLKTRAMFGRYNITTEQRILAKGKKIAEAAKQG